MGEMTTASGPISNQDVLDAEFARVGGRADGNREILVVGDYTHAILDDAISVAPRVTTLTSDWPLQASWAAM
jgi:hypothetical protein